MAPIVIVCVLAFSGKDYLQVPAESAFAAMVRRFLRRRALAAVAAVEPRSSR